MISRKRFTVSTALIALVLSGSTSDVHAANRGPDFDNDNIDDLAIGVPNQQVGVESLAGMVNVLYGSASGLTDPSNRITSIDRGVPGVEGAPDGSDFFGRTVSWGDFNADCFDDLAVTTLLGDLQIFYGSSTGLSLANDDIVVTAMALSNSSAAGDFNGDGFDDIAVQEGSMSEVWVLYGSSSGITDTAGPGLQIWDLDALGVSNPTGLELFGWSLATGDFNCDGKDDLAVGAPQQNVGAESGAGQVHIIYGTSSGLSATGTTAWHQTSPNVEGAAEAGDEFGYALATGNFNNDTSNGRACHDLAIGIPFEDAGAVNDGAVAVLFGTPTSGIQASSPADSLWYQERADVEGNGDSHEFFGKSIAVGNMDADSFEDLAIGIPGEGIGGAIAIIRGASGGMTDADDVLWTQDTNFVADDAEGQDDFGECVTYGREWYTTLNRGLAVCVPHEDVLGTTDAGMVNVMYLQDTSTPQLSILGGSWIQSSIDTQTVEADDVFGSSLTAARDRPFTSGSCG
ncbi:FG-GAP and VCBS repeat-containing protein [Nannocystis punicea]|uniref:FG-GAP and VCBS repeat-containing protein n=1 Tax=Nannocystis punicea TaxID=2995304 RepID=A0ABY7H0I4_9BACT|nr:FG-GAP and VCBS repeat-containing protein [Nannocystis poenicansa]WAS92761.1 FG-GAP and VCBS repeat-containing protein [Nannocystis poenicansa]